MELPLTLLPKRAFAHALFRTIGTTADSMGIRTYLVGGYVRDIYLGHPSKDMDFSCIGEGNGIGLARALQQKWRLPSYSLVIFKRFGTAQLRYKGYVLEFVTARKESYQADSRNPCVQPASFEEDLRRRDLTINAMAVSLNSSDYGSLIDLFSGLKALRSGLLETPLSPTKTFSDDPLRMLRAIRFATQLGFTLTPATLDGIMQTKERIQIVARERIRDELNLMISASKPSVGFRLLFDTGLLAIIFPEMAHLQGVDIVDGHAHKDNFYHTLEVLDNVAKVSEKLYLRWAALLHDIAKPQTKRYDPCQGWTFHGHEERGARMIKPLFRRFCLPLSQAPYVQTLVRLHLRPIALANEAITDTALRRLLHEAGAHLDDLMVLCRADITSKNAARVQKYLANFAHVEQRLQEVEEKDRIRNFQPPITGNMIMKTFGIGPSPIVGEAKRLIKNAILEGNIANEYEAAYALLIHWGRTKGLRATRLKCMKVNKSTVRGDQVHG